MSDCYITYIDDVLPTAIDAVFGKSAYPKWNRCLVSCGIKKLKYVVVGICYIWMLFLNKCLQYLIHFAHLNLGRVYSRIMTG